MEEELSDSAPAPRRTGLPSRARPPEAPPDRKGGPPPRARRCVRLTLAAPRLRGAHRPRHGASGARLLPARTPVGGGTVARARAVTAVGRATPAGGSKAR